MIVIFSFKYGGMDKKKLGFFKYNKNDIDNDDLRWGWYRKFFKVEGSMCYGFYFYVEYWMGWFLEGKIIIIVEYVLGF